MMIVIAAVVAVSELMFLDGAADVVGSVVGGGSYCGDMIVVVVFVAIIVLPAVILHLSIMCSW